MVMGRLALLSWWISRQTRCRRGLQIFCHHLLTTAKLMAYTLKIVRIDITGKVVSLFGQKDGQRVRLDLKNRSKNSVDEIIT